MLLGMEFRVVKVAHLHFVEHGASM